MNKISKMLKGGVLAAFFAVMMISPVFAAGCTAGNLTDNYPDLKVSNSATGEYQTKCNQKLTINNNRYTVYGKSTTACAQLGAISANPDGWCNNTDLTATVQGIINTVIFIVGMLAVVMIIIGGINYALSQGDPGKVKKAKDTILYGIIGLVVALLAFAIVQFVLSAIGNS